MKEWIAKYGGQAVLGLAVVFLVSQFVYSMFVVSPNLNNALNEIKKANSNLDEANRQINESKKQLDSAKSKIDALGLYIKDIQGRVQILDLEHRAKDEEFLKKKKSINTSLDSLYKVYNIKTDSLPVIKDL